MQILGCGSKLFSSEMHFALDVMSKSYRPRRHWCAQAGHINLLNCVSLHLSLKKLRHWNHKHAFLKFSTTSLKHLSYSTPNRMSKNRLMKATRLILTIGCGWLCMLTSILWPAWSAPLRNCENPSTASCVKHWKILESLNSNVILQGATKNQLFSGSLLFIQLLIKAFI